MLPPARCSTAGANGSAGGNPNQRRSTWERELKKSSTAKIGIVLSKIQLHSPIQRIDHGLRAQNKTIIFDACSLFNYYPFIIIHLLFIYVHYHLRSLYRDPCPRFVAQFGIFLIITSGANHIHALLL
jgi:hypothetical protein